MYKIKSKGQLLTVVEEPRYVKQNANQIWVQCSPSEATHVSIIGNLHDLAETEIIPVSPTDFIAEQNTAIEQLNAQLVYISMMTDVEIPNSQEVIENE